MVGDSCLLSHRSGGESGGLAVQGESSITAVAVIGGEQEGIGEISAIVFVSVDGYPRIIGVTRTHEITATHLSLREGGNGAAGGLE